MTMALKWSDLNLSPGNWQPARWIVSSLSCREKLYKVWAEPVWGYGIPFTFTLFMSVEDRARVGTIFKVFGMTLRVNKPLGGYQQEKNLTNFG